MIYLGQLRGLSGKEASRRGKEWCTKLEIKDWWGKKIEDLSKGMAQKIQFIATVMHEPELIILDEPTNGLDPQGMVEIRKLILKLNKENGITIMLSSHLLSEVLRGLDYNRMRK